ncbi:MAG: SET domain-containing protein [Deltaproteobacteria bacterium]|nr:SET domain-containing protein [Deltaproteobacteria bacterium]
MVHPDTTLAFIDEIVGYGVVATQPIPKGTIVWVEDPLDQRFTPARMAEMPDVLRTPVERYSYRDHRGDMVLCWDLAKYFNHSCESSCLGLDFPFEVAVRDIAPGEQLTDDHGTFYLLGAERFACRCGAPGCRGAVTPEDRKGHEPTWRQMLAAALGSTQSVAQPLAELLLPGELDAVVRRYISGVAAASTRRPK